jgi:hypothetical protein
MADGPRRWGDKYERDNWAGWDFTYHIPSFWEQDNLGETPSTQGSGGSCESQGLPRVAGDVCAPSSWALYTVHGGGLLHEERAEYCLGSSPSPSSIGLPTLSFLHLWDSLNVFTSIKFEFSFYLCHQVSTGLTICKMMTWQPVTCPWRWQHLNVISHQRSMRHFCSKKEVRKKKVLSLRVTLHWKQDGWQSYKGLSASVDFSVQQGNSTQYPR